MIFDRDLAAQDIIEAEVEKQAIADAALGNAGHERFKASPAGLTGLMVRRLRAVWLVEAWRAHDGSWFYRIDMGIISGRALLARFVVLAVSALVMIAAALYVLALFGVAVFAR